VLIDWECDSLLRYFLQHRTFAFSTAPSPVNLLVFDSLRSSDDRLRPTNSHFRRSQTLSGFASIKPDYSLLGCLPGLLGSSNFSLPCILDILSDRNCRRPYLHSNGPFPLDHPFLSNAGATGVRLYGSPSFSNGELRRFSFSSVLSRISLTIAGRYGPSRAV